MKSIMAAFIAVQSDSNCKKDWADGKLLLYVAISIFLLRPFFASGICGFHYDLMWQMHRVAFKEKPV